MEVILPEVEEESLLLGVLCTNQENCVQTKILLVCTNNGAAFKDNFSLNMLVTEGPERLAKKKRDRAAPTTPGVSFQPRETEK